MATQELYFISATTQATDPDAAVDDLLAQIAQQQMDPETPFDLVLLYMSVDYLPNAQGIAQAIYKRLVPTPPTVLMGGVAEGVIGPGKEYEGEAAITMVAGVMPDVTLTPFVMGNVEMSQYLQDPAALQTHLGSKIQQDGQIRDQSPGGIMDNAFQRGDGVLMPVPLVGQGGIRIAV